MNYEFSLILKEGTEITEELADELFEAGCVVERLQIEHDSPLLAAGAG